MTETDDIQYEGRAEGGGMKMLRLYPKTQYDNIGMRERGMEILHPYLLYNMFDSI